MTLKSAASAAAIVIWLAAMGAPVFAAGSVQTVGYHNVHLRVSDPAKAIEWYTKYLGASVAPPPYSVMFGKTLVAFVKTDKQQPSAGSVIDHIGLSYPDLQAKMKEFEAGGATIVQPIRQVEGLFPLGFIEDPWGVKIEVVQDPSQLGFHHVHLRVKDPAATLKWFEENFGGTRGKLGGRIDGVRYSGVWVLAASSGTDAPVPSADRAIQNMAIQVASVDTATEAFRSKNTKVVVEPRSLGALRYAFIEDPNGVRIELIEQH
jgi:catechol 2,3-dioxygenase-like lactoylglutathione lyase family enzyme